MGMGNDSTTTPFPGPIGRLLGSGGLGSGSKAFLSNISLGMQQQLRGTGTEWVFAAGVANAPAPNAPVLSVLSGRSFSANARFMQELDGEVSVTTPQPSHAPYARASSVSSVNFEGILGSLGITANKGRKGSTHSASSLSAQRRSSWKSGIHKWEERQLIGYLLVTSKTSKNALSAAGPAAPGASSRRRRQARHATMNRAQSDASAHSGCDGGMTTSIDGGTTTSIDGGADDDVGRPRSARSSSISRYYTIYFLNIFHIQTRKKCMLLMIILLLAIPQRRHDPRRLAVCADCARRINAYMVGPILTAHGAKRQHLPRQTFPRSHAGLGSSGVRVSGQLGR